MLLVQPLYSQGARVPVLPQIQVQRGRSKRKATYTHSFLWRGRSHVAATGALGESRARGSAQEKPSGWLGLQIRDLLNGHASDLWVFLPLFVFAAAILSCALRQNIMSFAAIRDDPMLGALCDRMIGSMMLQLTISFVPACCGCFFL